MSALATLGFNIATSTAQGSGSGTQDVKGMEDEFDDDFEVLQYALEYDDLEDDMGDNQLATTPAYTRGWISIADREASGRTLNIGGKYILDTNAPCVTCNTPITHLNAATEPKGAGKYTVRTRCRVCMNEYVSQVKYGTRTSTDSVSSHVLPI